MVKKFQKSTRHNHQYLRVRVGPEVNLDFRGHLNMAAIYFLFYLFINFVDEQVIITTMEN